MQSDRACCRNTLGWSSSVSRLQLMSRSEVVALRCMSLLKSTSRCGRSIRAVSMNGASVLTARMVAWLSGVEAAAALEPQRRRGYLNMPRLAGLIWAISHDVVRSLVPSHGVRRTTSTSLMFEKAARMSLRSSAVSFRRVAPIYFQMGQFRGARNRTIHGFSARSQPRANCAGAREIAHTEQAPRHESQSQAART